MGTVGRHWANKVYVEEMGRAFKDAKSLAIYLEVSVSMVYQALRGTKSHVKGYHVRWDK